MNLTGTVPSDGWQWRAREAHLSRAGRGRVRLGHVENDSDAFRLSGLSRRDLVHCSSADGSVALAVYHLSDITRRTLYENSRRHDRDIPEGV
jgi:hypothetical protein